jgi:hypothetical protein
MSAAVCGTDPPRITAREAAALIHSAERATAPFARRPQAGIVFRPAFERCNRSALRRRILTERRVSRLPPPGGFCVHRRARCGAWPCGQRAWRALAGCVFRALAGERPGTSPHGGRRAAERNPRTVSGTRVARVCPVSGTGLWQAIQPPGAGFRPPSGLSAPGRSAPGRDRLFSAHGRRGGARFPCARRCQACPFPL